MKPRTIKVEPFPTVITDKGICDVARVSFLKPAEDFTDEKNKGLLKYLKGHNHWSPYGHAYIGFNLFISTEHQLFFFLDAELAGFSWESSMDGHLCLVGSLWAWYENLKWLPKYLHDEIKYGIYLQFPWTYEHLFGEVPTPKLGRISVLRLKDTSPKLTYASVRCIAPCFVARQLGKHQVKMVWNEESRRYVDDPPQTYDMGEWRARPDGSIKQGSGGIHPGSDLIQTEVEYHHQQAIRLYNILVEKDVAPEQARAVLPQAQQFEWIWTANLTAFKRVCNQRLDSHAQKETQEFGRQLDSIMRSQYPDVWDRI